MVAVRAGGALETVIDRWDVAVCCGELLSFTVRITGKVPAEE